MTTGNIHIPINLIRGILLAVLYCSTFILDAQTPFFRLVRTPETMRETVINCMYQDLDGLIWIGTSHGLYRFDGRGIILMPSPASTSDLQVSAVFMDPSRILWIGTRGGKIFQVKGDSMAAFTPQEGLPEKAITGFTSDKRGNIWFSTYGEGVYYFNGRYLYNINTDDGLTDDYCYGVIADGYGRIWVATDGGISVCNASVKLKKVDKITTDQGLPDNIVLSLVKGRNGIIWAGMQDGGFCSVSSNSMKIFVPEVSLVWKYGPVKDILVFNDILWLTSERNGLLEVNPSSPGEPVSYSSGDNFSFPRINRLLADNQGNSWMVTNSELIFSAGPGFKRIQNIGKFSPGSIQSILQDHFGRVWFSNEDRLFSFWPMETDGKNLKETKLPFRQHTHIISLYEDTSGFIWAGTFGSGLFRINPVTGYARLINEKDGLTNGNILSIAGCGNEIWLATLGGAYRCTLTGNPGIDGVSIHSENFSQQNGPGNNYIYKVFADSRKRIWFGTDGKGISVYEKGHFKSFGEKNGIRSRVVYSITEDMNGHIWFTTSNAGVYEYDGKNFRNYTTANGLTDMQISCLAADKQHHVFFAYDRGIDVLDIRTGSFIYYSSDLGLDAMNPDLNVISGSGTNLLWLGTQQGMIRLELRGENMPQRPSLKLNKVAVFLGPENYLSRHEFSYSQNHLSFFFNATWFIAPDLVTYQIKLEGYDLDWINTRDNLATYSSLPPGKYTFKVRTALKGNYSNSVIVTYSFTIGKPYWKTTWFIIAVILLFAVLVMAVIRLRETRFKRKEASEREKLLFQFQTLRSQVNPHFLFNSFSTLMSVIDEDKDLAIEYVQKLSQFFRNILEYRDKDLIALSEELKLIDTYRYLQQQRYGDNFQMEISILPEQGSTLIPPLTLQMIVENAIKHNVVSEDKPLKVKIYADSKYLFIRNNLQQKKLMETSTGIGLVNIRNRYRLIGLEGMEIQETQTEFIIRLPLIIS